MRIIPPEALMTEVSIPEFKGATNGDLFTWASDVRPSAERANIQIRAIREWAHGKMEEHD